MALSLVLVLAVAVVAKPLEPCPSSCRCYLSEGLKRADCRGVPEWADKQSDAQDVRISPPAAGRGARSAALHLTHFEVFPRVLQLSVTNRSIVEVIPSGFHGLRSLQELDLSNNLLSRFNYKVFVRMPALRRLVLAGNPIMLDQGVPLLTSRSLLSLDLSHCDIVDVPKGSLDGMRNLTSLSLRGNPLQLQQGRPLLTVRSGSAITELDLSACELDTIPDGVLDGLTSLRRLYLDGNNLVVVDRGVLPRGLHHLDLSGNFIRDAPTAVISSLRNLTKLELSDNPITCTCSLIGFQGWLSRQLVVTERPVVCAGPPQYRGKSWTKVNELELCREEEKQANSTSDTNSSDESSSSSSDDDDDDGKSSSASALDEPLPDDLYDDESLELPPASYELYTHENVIGASSQPANAPSALPLKVLKLPRVDMARRTRSHNDINYFQADAPYDSTTSKYGETAEEATAASVAPDATAEAATETSVESAADGESETSEIGEDDVASVEDNGGDSVDDNIETGEHEEPEKDAETLFKNADTIAMGKSMPETSDHAEDKEVEPATDSPTTEADVREGGVEAEAAPEPTPAPSAEEAEPDAAEAEAEHPASEPGKSEEQPQVAAAPETVPVEVLETTTLVPETSPAAEAASVSEDSSAPAPATSEDSHEGHGQEHAEGAAAAAVAVASLVGEDSSTDAPATTTAPAPAEDISESVNDGDRSDHGRSLAGDAESLEAGHSEMHPTDHPEEDHQGGASTEEAPIPAAAEADGDAGEEAGAVVIPAAAPELPEETVLTTEAPQPVVEEAIVPAVAKNVVGSENDESDPPAKPEPEVEEPVPESPASEVPEVAVVPEDETNAEVPANESPAPAVDVPLPIPEAAEPTPEVKPETAVEPDPVETVPAPKSVPELSEVPAVVVPEAPEEGQAEAMTVPPEVPSAAPGADSETVDSPPPGDKHNEDLAVEPVPPSQRDGADEDADLQKSTITYVILGCVVVAMVVLVMYALLRKKAKKDESANGKPAGVRIRRENGDDHNHLSNPEGTELKDMMNPLLGVGSAHPEGQEHPEHGRRASLVSLELIREEDDEATRLQPSADNVDHGPPALPAGAKGAAEPAKAKAATRANGGPTGAAVGPTAPNGKANGKPSAEAAAPTAAPTEASTPGQHRAAPQPAAEQPSKVTVKAGVISTPVPSTPVLVNRANGVNRVNGGLNGVNGKVNGVGRNA